MHVVFVGTPDEMPKPEGNHKQRRVAAIAERRLAKRQRRERTIVLTEDSIPAGSRMSDESLALIRAGKIGLAKYEPPGFGMTPPKPQRNPSRARRYERRHPEAQGSA